MITVVHCSRFFGIDIPQAKPLSPTYDTVNQRDAQALNNVTLHKSDVYALRGLSRYIATAILRDKSVAACALQL